jgi:hypothetical protein
MAFRIIVSYFPPSLARTAAWYSPEEYAQLKPPASTWQRLRSLAELIEERRYTQERLWGPFSEGTRSKNSWQFLLAGPDVEVENRGSLLM